MKRVVAWKKVIHDWPNLNGIELPRSDAAEFTVLIGVDNPASHEVLETLSDPLRKRAPRPSGQSSAGA